MHEIGYLYLIPLLPLIGAAVNLLLGRRLGRQAVHFVACGVVLGAATLALNAVFVDLWPLWKAGGHGAVPAVSQTVYEWIRVGDFALPIKLVVDPLTAVMICVVTIVGFFIHVYSMGYMAHEPDYARFFGYLNLFTGSMLILVLADSLPVMFVGWEGVGLCSYLLIGFWYQKDVNAYSGRKAFVVNRIGDFAFLLGMFLIYVLADTLSMSELRQKTEAMKTVLWLGGTGAFFVGLLLFIGATGKSAQFPLYVWLPDAMAGPTPVSALIHAATMVTAGVYMVARLNFVYVMSPGVMAIVALVGAFTALYAATIGFAQNDIKKVLAYSTISQLGFMFAAVGMGAFGAGVFHLYTHAFFKACLFLGAGSVMHAMGDRGDIREMGGLRKKIPYTHATFLVSTLALAGIVPFAGFFSKDAILAGAFGAHNPTFPLIGKIVYVALVAAAFCTAFYMFRLYWLVFSGTCRADEHTKHHIHESPRAMTIPLMVLAFGALVGGFIGLPSFTHADAWSAWLAPMFPHGGHEMSVGVEVGLMVLALVVAGAGIGCATMLYRNGEQPAVQRIVLGLRWVYSAVAKKYKVDEIYDYIFVRPLRGLAHILRRVVDEFLIDLVIVNGSAWAVDFIGRGAKRLQSGDAQRYLVAVLVGVAAIVFFASRPPATFHAPVAITVGAEFQPDASALGKSGRDLSFKWDFSGKGQWQDAGVRPTHRFTAPGKYTVQLKVKDRRFGTERVTSRQVEVRP
ncbi:MAG TPA: NADH-quinone oxidoreductase subunit L [Polyangia bacterium]|jgi:NADH-quinone oxidoreductase subunit L